MRIASLLVLVLIVSGCARQGPLASEPTFAEGALVLRPGDEVAVPGTALSVRLLGVGADSRCATDVECVWEGDAEVSFRITRSGNHLRDLTLHTALDPRHAEVGEYRVELIELAPEPVSGTAIPQSAYSATISVTLASAVDPQ